MVKLGMVYYCFTHIKKGCSIICTSPERVCYTKNESPHCETWGVYLGSNMGFENSKSSYWVYLNYGTYYGKILPTILNNNGLMHISGDVSPPLEPYAVTAIAQSF